MAITSVLNAAYSGLRAEAQRAAVVADNVVNANSENHTAKRTQTTSVVAGGADPDRGAGVRAEILDTGQPVDFGQEFSRLIAADLAYTANAEVIRSADRLQKSLLDVVS